MVVWGPWNPWVKEVYRSVHVSGWPAHSRAAPWGEQDCRETVGLPDRLMIQTSSL